MKKFIKFLPHVSIIISGMYVVLYIVDPFNPTMQFIDNPGTKFLLLILAISSVFNSVMLVYYQRREYRAWLKRRREKAMKSAANRESSENGTFGRDYSQK